MKSLLFSYILALAASFQLPGQILSPILTGLNVSTGGSPITLNSHTAIGSTTTTTTSAINTTGANFIVVNCAWLFGQSVTITDSKSNTWTPLTVQTQGATYQTGQIYTTNPTVGSGHTFTITAAGSSFFSCEVAAFNNVATVSPFDQQNGNNAGSGTTIQTGSVTPGSNNELIVAGLDFPYNPSTVSINSSFTITDTINFTSGMYFGSSLGYLVQTTAAAVNPTWTLGTSQTGTLATIATFK